MHLKSIELTGFKSFAKKTNLDFKTPITAIVGPNGSGKSNVAEAFRFVLGEQSIKSLRGKRGEDMIFNGSKTAGRLNRASVKVTFDNSSKFLNIDFDEVSIERVVHRDNQNEYLINGSQVRLKDIVELLSQAHIGPSGHHIISQGEADRILNANNKERRLMIEEALGLKIYQYKKLESERKLERTKENTKQVESLRKEIAPHLKFLSKQVEKIEKAKEIRDSLIDLYNLYLKREDSYIREKKKFLESKLQGPTEKIIELEESLINAKKALESSEKSDFGKKVIALETILAETRKRKDLLLREFGKIEGEITSEERLLSRIREMKERDGDKKVSVREARDFTSLLEEKVNQATSMTDLNSVKKIVASIKDTIANFLKLFETTDTTNDEELSIKSISKLRERKDSLNLDLEKMEREESVHEKEYLDLKQKVDEEKDIGRKSEREIFRLMTLANEERAKKREIEGEISNLEVDKFALEKEFVEAKALVGFDYNSLENLKLLTIDMRELPTEEAVSLPRIEQHELLKKIERNKIKLEEQGIASSEDILREYKDVEERDKFLERELADLYTSSTSLETLIRELTDKLDYEFREGVKRINVKFSEFFSTMFGGGGAELALVKEEKRSRFGDDLMIEEMGSEVDEEIVEEGIEIKVSLPHKKIRGLEMLSGGERALTSIALLFSISQVNPPPFIILDETDAALDEANSRKYGNMIDELSKYSQLILITHNRETMSRAGVLYGVTMGQDAISKLLSIEFDEAVRVAK